MAAKYKLVEEMKRSALAEGRNYGMGFAFLKKDGKILTTVHGCSPCRDFCNDVVYSEASGQDYSIYGLHAKKQDIFADGNGYLLISICKKGAAGKGMYDDYKRDYLTLKDNLPNLVLFINKIEDTLKLEQKTTIEKLRINKYVVILPLFWTKYTYLTSLFTLLLRVGAFYDGKMDTIKFLETFTQDSSDMYLLKSAMNKIKLILGGEIPVQDIKNCKSPHNSGIVGFQFPVKKAEPVKPVVKESIKSMVEKAVESGAVPAVKTAIKKSTLDDIWAEMELKN